MGIGNREQVIINLAVSVLREAMVKAGEQPIDTLHAAHSAGEVLRKPAFLLSWCRRHLIPFG